MNTAYFTTNIANYRAQLDALTKNPPYMRIDGGQYLVYGFSPHCKCMVLMYTAGAADLGIRTLRIRTDEHERSMRDLGADLAEAVYELGKAEEKMAAEVSIGGFLG